MNKVPTLLDGVDDHFKTTIYMPLIVNVPFALILTYVQFFEGSLLLLLPLVLLFFTSSSCFIIGLVKMLAFHKESKITAKFICYWLSCSSLFTMFVVLYLYETFGA